MQIIDKSSSEGQRTRKLTYNTKKYIRIGRAYHHTYFSYSLCISMHLENKGVIIGKEGDKIFIAKSDSDTAFTLREYKKTRQCTTSAFGRIILQHFNLDQSKPHRIYVADDPVIKSGIEFYELTGITEPE